MNLGDKLIALRKENKISQEKLAEELDVTRQTVSNWENYKSYPDISTIVKISNIFNISLDILLKGDTKMISDIDTKIKNSKKYKNILIIICVILFILIASFSIYYFNYNNIKNELETKFEKTLKDNNFIKNRDGYYSYEYNDKTKYGVPNQIMPSLFDFRLDFHSKYIYCDIENKDGSYIEGSWIDYDNYYFVLYDNDDLVIGSSSSIEKDKNNISKLSKELKMSEKELKELIDKGNELYKQFYK